jgi:DNA helicase MCM9
MAESLILADPTAISSQHYKTHIVKYLLTCEYQKLYDILAIPSGLKDQYHPFPISMNDLVHFDSSLAYTLIYYPALLLPLFNESIQTAQNSALNSINSSPSDNSSLSFSVKPYVLTRVYHLPPIADLSKDNIGQLRAEDVGPLIQIYGTIVRTGSVRMLELSKQYQCMNNKCGFRFTVHADPEQVSYLRTLTSRKICIYFIDIYIYIHAYYLIGKCAAAASSMPIKQWVINVCS